MQFCDNASVSAFFAIEPFGYAGDGRRTETCRALDLQVRYLFGKQFGRLEAFGEFYDLLFRQKVAQEAPCLVGSF